MCKIWIFGGTTEGRLLAEYCSREKIEAWVSVASEYGEELLQEELMESGNAGNQDLNHNTCLAKKNLKTACQTCFRRNPGSVRTDRCPPGTVPARRGRTKEST